MVDRPTSTAAATIARRLLTTGTGHSGTGAAAGSGITAGSAGRRRSHQIRKPQATTARAARVMPIHIVRCGVHVIVTVTGVAEPGNRQPLKPPEICRGAPRSTPAAAAFHPLL